MGCKSNYKGLLYIGNIQWANGRVCTAGHTPKAVTYHETKVMVHTPKAVTYHETKVMVHTPKAVTYHETKVMWPIMHLQ